MSDGPLSDVKILDLTRLLPGGFCTLLLADLGADVIKVEDTGQGDYVRWAPPYYGAEQQTPLGRIGRVDDVAPVVTFLASDDAKWVTGQVLYVSGGNR